MRFDEHYREDLLLAGGRRVTLRAFVAPGSELRGLLLEGFSRLSPSSRELRFFSGKPRLTSGDLDYLTELDGDTHLAIGALEEGPHGPRGLGVARFVRLADDRDVAEPAVTVVDEAQGLGLGTLLLDRLVHAARERGIKRFHAEFLSRNQGVRKLLLDVVPDARFHEDGDGVIIAELPLHAGDGQPDQPTHLTELIRRVLKTHGGGSPSDAPPR